VAVVVVLSVQTMETTVAVLVTAVQMVAVLAHINRQTQVTAFMVVLLDQTVQPILAQVVVGTLMVASAAWDTPAVQALL
jgi:hypothetical protein